jgi:hypothetical protein
MGSDNVKDTNPEARGIIPRVVQDIFSQIKVDFKFLMLGYI